MVSYLKSFCGENRSVVDQKKKTLFNLFISFIRIGAFTWGGGYAMVPLIQKELVDKKQLISDEDFITGLSVAQGLPGAIAINTACYVGQRVAGFPGMLTAVLGSVLPSFLIILMAATFLFHFGDHELVQHFFRGATPAIVALIACGIVSIGKKALKKRIDLVLAVVLFTLVLIFRFHPLWIVLLGAFTGLWRKS